MNPRSETPKEEGPWAWQAREAAAKAGQIGINAYAVYCALTHFQSAAAAEHKRRFCASYEQLAEHVGCARNTIARCLPELQKAGLIRIFSGANGSFRATRNAFFLCSISQPSQGHGRPSQGEHVKPCEGEHVKPSQGCFNKKKNNYTAPPQAAAGVVEKENQASARLPLRGSGGAENEGDEITNPADLERLAKMREAAGFC